MAILFPSNRLSDVGQKNDGRTTPLFPLEMWIYSGILVGRDPVALVPEYAPALLNPGQIFGLASALRYIICNQIIMPLRRENPM
ncbi:MAG: hypothetical protein CVV35_09155 [Methanomicrobiales archaeon HGW-Methanomicrobiales-6]|jgi:hypothetical protein|nr:MAG: hypothetical protein CVV35_09155 [Methanomicrobiales archaeon HGW-Methanomicrobiales-6]